MPTPFPLLFWLLWTRWSPIPRSTVSPNKMGASSSVFIQGGSALQTYGVLGLGMNPGIQTHGPWIKVFYLVYTELSKTLNNQMSFINCESSGGNSCYQLFLKKNKRSAGSGLEYSYSANRQKLGSDNLFRWTIDSLTSTVPTTFYWIL